IFPKYFVRLLPCQICTLMPPPYHKNVNNLFTFLSQNVLLQFNKIPIILWPITQKTPTYWGYALQLYPGVAMESEVLIESDLAVTAPGLLRVIRRNGSVTPYDDSKIAVAMTKAFLAVEGGNAAASTRIRELVTRMTDQISEAFRRRWPSGGTIHI